MIRLYLFLFCSLTLIVFDVNGEIEYRCKCFNPWAGNKKYKYMGDPALTCPNFCYVPKNCDFEDTQQARGKGRYFSKIACLGVTGSGYNPKPKTPPPPCKPYGNPRTPCTPGWKTPSWITSTWTPRTTTTWTRRTTKTTTTWTRRTTKTTTTWTHRTTKTTTRKPQPPPSPKWTTWTPKTTKWTPYPSKGKCKCIDPWKGSTRYTWGDPRRCCPKFCYVSCHSRCRDKQPARGHGRCWSKLGCIESRVVPYG